MAGTMRRRRLAAALRRFRSEAALTQDEVVKRLGPGWTTPKLSKIEGRVTKVSIKDLRSLLDVYGVEDQTVRAELTDMARRSSERGWWEEATYGSAVPNEYATVIDAEQEATSIREYESELVPGLLQTDDYARAVFRACWRTAPDEAIDRRVDVRQGRREILTRPSPPPPKLTVIINEAVLLRRVGGPEVMSAQLRHLITQQETAGSVTIQVLPFSTGAHPSMVGPFMLLNFSDQDDLGIVYSENMTSSLVLEEPDDITMYEDAWSALQAQALSPADSIAVMRTYELR